MTEFRFQNRLPLLDNEVLRTFLAISQTGSFTLAAEQVLRTPSAVSMQIKKLEEQLSATLFQRDARSVSLTPHGELLLTYARRILELNNEAVSMFVMPDMNGVVRLGAPEDIGELVLPRLLSHMAQTWPHLVVEVTINSSRDLFRAVEERRIDLSLVNVIDEASFPGVETVMTEKLVWAGKRNGQAHMKTPLPVSVWNEDCCWRKRAFTALEQQRREYRIAYFCAHNLGQLAAIRADIAIAPLARFLLRDDMVELGEADGLPDLGCYRIGLSIRESAGEPIRAVADHIRGILGSRCFIPAIIAA
ncbi:LysR family transcriptional regulator [Allorhizobium sp. BGMRC 0089]|uniref:LysR family transcriptional regulator n=1 Tax=Allorhizobium sonneratiae TaxID=2934936 RepID=UPI0020343CB7|nr:LysR family transcriptional regulator [Allorhizobium sonneratiae]MCM2292993.1 LysR family transcriptional regulator [Allorhizobium sonneratiae]